MNVPTLRGFLKSTSYVRSCADGPLRAPGFVKNADTDQRLAGTT